MDGLLVDPIGAGAVQMLVRATKVRVRFGDWRFWWRGCCGGPKVLALLSEMPFGHCNGFREIFGDEFSRQPRPGGKIAGFDGFEPGGLGWAEAGTVQVGNEVRLVAHLVDVVGVLGGEHAVRWSSGGKSTRKCFGHWGSGEADVPEAVVVVSIAK